MFVLKYFHLDFSNHFALSLYPLFFESEGFCVDVATSSKCSAVSAIYPFDLRTLAFVGEE